MINCQLFSHVYYPAVAHISTHSVKVAFGSKSGFKNKYRTGFGL